jgi:hypothetical protein
MYSCALTQIIRTWIFVKKNWLLGQRAWYLRLQKEVTIALDPGFFGDQRGAYLPRKKAESADKRRLIKISWIGETSVSGCKTGKNLGRKSIPGSRFKNQGCYVKMSTVKMSTSKLLPLNMCHYILSKLVILGLPNPYVLPDWGKKSTLSFFNI